MGVVSINAIRKDLNIKCKVPVQGGLGTLREFCATSAF